MSWFSKWSTSELVKVRYDPYPLEFWTKLKIIETPFLFEFLIFLFSVCYLVLCCFSLLKIWEKSIVFRLFDYIEWFFAIFAIIALLCFNETLEDYSQYHDLASNLAVLDYGFFFGDALLYNNFSYWSCCILIFSFLNISAWFDFVFMHRLNWKTINEFALIFLSCTFFMMVLLSVHDFFLFLFIIVAGSLSLYGLILINLPIFSNAPEVGVKYFLLSAISVGLMLGGVKEFFLLAGHLNFSVVHNAIFEKIIHCNLYVDLFSIKFAVFLFLIGFFSKIAAAPNHFWAPEVYAGMPYAFLLFFVVFVKFVFCLVFFKIIKNIFFIFFINDSLNYFLYNEIEFLCCSVTALSMLVGGINAIFEQNLRKFVAYSSINQMGFLLVSLLGFRSNFYCFESFLYFLIIYFSNLGFFIGFFIGYSHNFFLPARISFLCSQKRTNSFKPLNFFEYILFLWPKFYTLNLTFMRDLSKIHYIHLFEKNKRKAELAVIVAFALSVLSLAGIPPLPGFYSKMYILFYAVQTQHWIIFLTGILSSMLSIFYYLRVLKIMFFEKKHATFSIAESSLILQKCLFTKKQWELEKILPQTKKGYHILKTIRYVQWFNQNKILFFYNNLFFLFASADVWFFIIWSVTFYFLEGTYSHEISHLAHAISFSII